MGIEIDRKCAFLVADRFIAEQFEQGFRDAGMRRTTFADFCFRRVSDLRRRAIEAEAACTDQAVKMQEEWHSLLPMEVSDNLSVLLRLARLLGLGTVPNAPHGGWPCDRRHCNRDWLGGRTCVSSLVRMIWIIAANRR